LACFRVARSPSNSWASCCYSYGTDTKINNIYNKWYNYNCSNKNLSLSVVLGSHVWNVPQSHSDYNCHLHRPVTQSVSNLLKKVRVMPYWGKSTLATKLILDILQSSRRWQSSSISWLRSSHQPCYYLPNQKASLPTRCMIYVCITISEFVLWLRTLIMNCNQANNEMHSWHAVFTHNSCASC